MTSTVQEIRNMLAQADAATFNVLERSLLADQRKGVQQALAVARRRLQAQQVEHERIERLYAYQRQLAQQRDAQVVVGLDEVGRGSIAGPLAVGAVVLPDDVPIEGLNDSKQVLPEKRREIAQAIKDVALAWTVQYIEPSVIDATGMTASLVMAFRRALQAIEAMGVQPDIVLLDGNPLRMDPREVNVVKGDTRCASIAAASIIAKVERDDLMCAYAQQYPAYGWDECKGYASPHHIAAIKEHGLTPLHRVSFCTSFMQESLF